jgi:hypothetical protein
MPKEADVYNGGMERENYTSYADGEAEKGLKKIYVKFVMYVSREKE